MPGSAQRAFDAPERRERRQRTTLALGGPSVSPGYPVWCSTGSPPGAAPSASDRRLSQAASRRCAAASARRLNASSRAPAPTARRAPPRPGRSTAAHVRRVRRVESPRAAGSSRASASRLDGERDAPVPAARPRSERTSIAGLVPVGEHGRRSTAPRRRARAARRSRGARATRGCGAARDPKPAIVGAESTGSLGRASASTAIAPRSRAGCCRACAAGARSRFVSAVSQRVDQHRARAARLDHVVDVAALGGDVRVREPLPVVGDQLGAARVRVVGLLELACGRRC